MNYSISLINSINPLFFAILVVVGGLIAKGVYTYKTYDDLRGKAIREIVLGGLVLILVIGVFIVLPLIAGITINDKNIVLRIPSGLIFETINAEDIISAQVVTLDQPEYAITSKVAGTETRAYREGLFNLQNGTEAIVFLNGNKALFVETKTRPLLLGPDQFDDFVKNFGEKLISIQP